MSTVKTRLETLATGLGQVILPDLEDTQSEDSATVLKGIINPQVSSRVYPFVLPNETTYPAVVYALGGTNRVHVDGYPILRTDAYSLAILHDVYGTAASNAASIRTLLQNYSPTGEAGTVDVTDQADDYDEDLELYDVGLGCDVIHLARSTQTIPAAFLYLTDEDWDPGESFDCATGFAIARFNVLLVDKIPAGGVSGLSTIREQILLALAGWQPTSDWSIVEPEGGGVVSVHSNLVLWRDRFVTSRQRTFSA